jgi:hypothetical protein
MNARKFADKLKIDAKADHDNPGVRRPVRFRCYDVVLTYCFALSMSWHMSIVEQCKASDSDKLALGKLLDALKVPAHLREGRVVARQQRAGKWLPEVRHFTWPIERAVN